MGKIADWETIKRLTALKLLTYQWFLKSLLGASCPGCQKQLYRDDTKPGWYWGEYFCFQCMKDFKDKYHETKL